MKLNSTYVEGLLPYINEKQKEYIRIFIKLLQQQVE